MNDDPITGSGRCFPRVTEDFDANQPGLRDSSTAAGLKAAFWSRKLSPAAKFGRIVDLHRSAFEAEEAAVWDRADFYWKELWNLVLTAADADACWVAGKPSAGAGDITGPEFRSHFLNEVVLESHAGFFRGEVAAGLKPLDRPKFHLQALSDLIRQSPSITAEQERVLIDPLAVCAIEQHGGEAGRAAEGFWAMMAQLFPRQAHYLDAALAEIHAATMGQIQAAAEVRKLSIVETGIAQVEDLRRRSPANLGCYQLLGLFYHEQAIHLANAGAIPASFLALKKAEVYGGRNPVLAETESQLNAVLEAMRQKSDRIRETLRQKPGASLTAQGRSLVKDAATGSSEAANWDLSPEAKRIRAEREGAGPSPERTLARASEETGPMVRVKVTSKKPGEERLADWLGSAQGRRLRWQIVAAVVLCLITTVLLAREAWGGYARERAWQRTEAAMKASDDAATLDALGDFFSAPRPLRADRQSDFDRAGLYGRTMARWIASKSSRLTNEERRRLLKYKKQVVDRKLDKDTGGSK
jgi:hypothetical protein